MAGKRKSHSAAFKAQVALAAVKGDKARCKPGETIVRVDPRYFRPTEVETLLGDPTRAREKLGWTPKIRFPELVAEMMREDLKSAQRDDLVKKHGFATFDRHE